MSSPTKAFFETTNLDHTLLIGYYGGGNFGDELLLEVLLNQLSERRSKDIQIYYQKPQSYATFHHDFGYRILDASRSFDFLRNSLKKSHYRDRRRWSVGYGCQHADIPA